MTEDFAVYVAWSATDKATQLNRKMKHFESRPSSVQIGVEGALGLGIHLSLFATGQKREIYLMLDVILLFSMLNCYM